MITLVLTNRNRDIRIIKNCLDSLHHQSDVDFEFFLVDYGSDLEYLEDLQNLLLNYPQIQFVSCPTRAQLWSKCRAINIAVQKASQPYFVVGDIDLIFHPNYIEILKSMVAENKVHYFQYGFLNESESLKKLAFSEYQIDFKGFQEVTGNTMFPTAALKKVNGFDEFYQGWGAEDTDAHLRMLNLGLEVVFYDKQILVKHQWHPKAYRSTKSTHPFHSKLERINHAYMLQTKVTQRIFVNQHLAWGKLTNKEAYLQLEKPEIHVNLKNSALDFNALLAQLANFNQEVVSITISEVSTKENIKNKVKKIVGKKWIPYYAMEDLNNLLLEEIIKFYRNCPYSYSFNRQTKKIHLIINFNQ